MELGLVILPTLAIIFGFLDIGFVIFTWNTLQNAVREGTRYAITMQTEGGGVGQIQSVKNKTSQWALGFVNPNSTSASGADIPWVDVKFYDPDAISAASGTAGNALAGAGSNSPGNVVEVSIRNYPYRWMFPFSGSFTGVFYRPLGSSMALNVYSADVLGGVGLNGQPAL